ncbi:MAG: RsmE family RNA methyltransferase [Candidatus Dormibacteraceae bacterium]
MNIRGADAAHLARSLRARAGERIRVIDPGDGRMGQLLQVRLVEVSAHQVEGVVEDAQPYSPEPSREVTIGLALLPDAALKPALSRCTELGATSFYLIRAEHSGPREISEARLRRYGEICRESAMLAGRLCIPSVEGPVGFEEVIKQGGAVLLDRAAPSRLAELSANGTHTLLIGPEGGWSPAELAMVGERRASLGPRNLRAENAAATALAVILAGAGDL